MTDLPAWSLQRFKEAAAPLAETERIQVSIGKYRVIREVARGAMGVVYEAEDTELQRIVALKVMRELADAREELRRRFEREALAAAKLNHPNVVRVYDAGESAGRMYLVMELVRGKPLSEILGGRKYELRAMLQLLEKAARGVAAAHEAGIIHRDVKPANILVTESGEPKVGDFGLAHWIDSGTALTKSGSPLGTPMYMAPEQVTGSRSGLSTATDVYALGGILYEILTGRPPFTGENSGEIYSKIMNDDPVRPRLLSAKVDVELETICLKALDKDPQRRYAGAREFADDLRRFFEGESILARPPGPAAIAAKWVRRHRLVATAAFVLAVTAGAFWTWAVAARIAGVGERLAEARAALDGRGTALRGIQEAAARERDVAAGIQPHDGPERKKLLWDLQREIAALRTEAADRYGAAKTALEAAVVLDPGCREAHALLAGLAFEAYEKAEEQGDAERMELARADVDRHDDGSFRKRLAPLGRVSIDSRPPGAAVELHLYSEGDDRRLVAKLDRTLSATPVGEMVLPVGSYLAILRKEGYRDVRLPVLVARGKRQDIVVKLYTEAEIGGEGYVYVPAGPFIRGGDPEASKSEPRQVDPGPGDYFISRFEVRSVDYALFLDEIFQAKGRKGVARLLPRNAPMGDFMWIPADDLGTLRVPEDWDPQWPIAGISWENAMEYAAWLTTRAKARGESVEFRLPTGTEWEKAARGVDGRFFPWGNVFDWTFTNGGRSRAEAPSYRPAGAVEADASPYGVRDLAGNVREWCLDIADPNLALKNVRGGAWMYTFPEDFRSAKRFAAISGAANKAYGFRLVRVPVPKEH